MPSSGCLGVPDVPPRSPLTTNGLSSAPEDVRLNLMPGSACPAFSRLRFFTTQSSFATGSGGVPASSFLAACSACRRCSRNRLSCSTVSLRTACSFALVVELMLSRNSTSSSSRARNWFLRRIDWRTDELGGTVGRMKPDEYRPLRKHLVWRLCTRRWSMSQDGSDFTRRISTFVGLQSLVQRLAVVLLR